jgi:nitrogen fixation protein FixH
VSTDTPTQRSDDDGKGKITGRHVAIGFVAFFGTVIAVNLYMASRAVGSFPGLETDNTFMDSQTFDARVAAQQALGWQVTAGIEEVPGAADVLAIRFTDAAGAPVEVAGLDATVGRATHTRADIAPEFTYRLGTFRSGVDLAPGQWEIRLVAEAPDGTPFKARLELDVD